MTEGDLGLDADAGVHARRAAVEPGPWSYLRQVHGAAVHRVTRPGAVLGLEGDALVGAAGAGPLAVFTADCAPVVFSADEGVVGVAHAGWRGLAAGVLAATATAMRSLGARRIVAALGPCIRAECYEFGAAELAAVADVLGDDVRGVTAGGRPALDMAAAVRAALERADVALVDDARACTACCGGYFSHRARGDSARQATVVVGPA